MRGEIVVGIIAASALMGCSRYERSLAPRAIDGKEQVPAEARIDPRTHSRDYDGAVESPARISDETVINAAPSFPRAPDFAPPGYYAERVAWTDGGFDSSWTTKAPYQPKITHRLELRPERAGVRVEFVPDDAGARAFLFFADTRSRAPRWRYWSTYREVASCNRFVAAFDRKVGAVNSVRMYPAPGERVTVQMTHPYPTAALIEWCQP